MPRVLTPLPIVVSSAVAAAVMAMSDRLDDMTGGVAVVAISHVLMWIGLRGDPAQPAGRAERVALAIGGAAPTAACLLALTPWLARGDGMESLGTVVMMMVFGVPLGVAAFAALILRASRLPRVDALAQTLAVVGGTIAIAWILASVWAGTRARGSDKALELLVFPGLATWWLVLPLAEWLAMRSRR
ncbi:MAG TPA: hypothetical protein VFG69_18115 [Nannocystaceae bacterium]|nr:hypothetical protein [Nannocystaceae bacterium]